MTSFELVTTGVVIILLVLGCIALLIGAFMDQEPEDEYNDE